MNNDDDVSKLFPFAEAQNKEAPPRSRGYSASRRDVTIDTRKPRLTMRSRISENVPLCSRLCMCVCFPWPRRERAWPSRRSRAATQGQCRASYSAPRRASWLRGHAPTQAPEKGPVLWARRRSRWEKVQGEERRRRPGEPPEVMEVPRRSVNETPRK